MWTLKLQVCFYLLLVRILNFGIIARIITNYSEVLFSKYLRWVVLTQKYQKKLEKLPYSWIVKILNTRFGIEIIESLHSVKLCNCYYHLLLLITIMISILTHLVNECTMNLHLFEVL